MISGEFRAAFSWEGFEPTFSFSEAETDRRILSIFLPGMWLVGMRVSISGIVGV